MTEYGEILGLADWCGINFLPGDVLAAISVIINSSALVDRRNPKVIAAHNANVLASHETLSTWVRDPLGVPDTNKRNFLNMATLGDPLPVAVFSTFPEVFAGEEGHTHPIEPTAQGTGSLRQKKTPKYDKYGHVI